MPLLDHCNSLLVSSSSFVPSFKHFLRSKENILLILKSDCVPTFCLKLFHVILNKAYKALHYVTGPCILLMPRLLSFFLLLNLQLFKSLSLLDPHRCCFLSLEYSPTPPTSLLHPANSYPTVFILLHLNYIQYLCHMFTKNTIAQLIIIFLIFYYIKLTYK